MRDVPEAGATPWFVPADGTDGAARIYVFPHAGGGPASISGLPAPRGAELWTVNLPGRQARMGDEPRTDLHPLAEELADWIAVAGVPRFALFGYCSGALLAYLVARRLEAVGHPPQRLFAGSFAAPDVARIPRRLHLLPATQFWAELNEWGGLPPMLAEREDLRPIFEPALRADLALQAGYRHEPAPPLSVPISVLHGRHDTSLGRGALLGWRRHGACRPDLVEIDASHWLVEEAPAEVSRALGDALPREPAGSGEGVSRPEDIVATVAAAMPKAVADLGRLVAIPSVAFPGHPAAPVHAAAEAVEELLRRAGLAEVRQIPLPDSYPLVYGATPGTPTVLLYAHYDVQPPGEAARWRTRPYEPTVTDGVMYGRGAADDKSGVITHVAALGAFGGRPPVGVKMLVEGQEEYSSEPLESFIAANPELLRADCVIIADAGNLRLGEPVLITSLRGAAACTVVVKTLADAVHGGEFGGPAPDALAALNKMLASLHDERGAVAVPGLEPGVWPGGDGPSPAEFAATAGVLDGVALLGDGPVADRLWAGPAITVTGMDVPPIALAVNAVQPQAAARIVVRVPPGTDPRAALDATLEHLRRAAPWGAQVTVSDEILGPGFRAGLDGPHAAALRRAMERAYGRPAGTAGMGSSIPAAAAFARAFPDAEILIFGAQDKAASIHAANERVSLAELEKTILTEALFLDGFRVRPPVPR